MKQHSTVQRTAQLSTTQNDTTQHETVQRTVQQSTTQNF